MSDNRNDTPSNPSPDEDEASTLFQKVRPSCQISEEKIHAWASIMNQVALEATEERLQKLHPKAPSELTQMKWSLAMDETLGESKQDSKAKHPSHFLRWWGVACAAVLLLCGVSLTLLRDTQVGRADAEIAKVAPSIVGTGDLNRQTVRVVDHGVKWNPESGNAERSYLVDYEDSVELEDNNGNRVLISAPATKMVVVPIETY